MYLIGLVPVLAISLASAPEDTVPQPAPAPATQPADTVAPAQPKKGTGLLVTTGVVAGTALGVTIARNVILRKNCPLDSGVAACTYDFRSDIGLGVTQWTLNIATIGLAAGTGTILGRYHAWKDASSGRARNVKLLRGVGGGLIGAGAVGVISSVALAFVLPKRCVEKELESGDPLAGDRCLLSAYPAWTMTNFMSFSMISAGTGLVAYGSNYRSRRGAVASFSLNPYIGRSEAGIGISGRF